MDFMNNQYNSEFMDVINVFKKYFDSKLFFIESHKNYFYVYYKYPGFNEQNFNNGSECLKVKIYQDPYDLNSPEKIYIKQLKYVQPNICKISGSELLYKIYMIGKELNMNIVIESDDAVKRYFARKDSKAQCSINLADYNILLKGMSWYNQFGYFTEDHKEQSETNEDIRNQTISEYFNDSYEKINNIINTLNQMDPNAKLTFETPIKDVVKVIDVLKRKEENQLFCDSPLILIIREILMMHKIEYNDEDLELEINDSYVHEIYNNLSKKLKMTTGGRNRKHRKTNRKHKKSYGKPKKRHYTKSKKRI